MSQNDDRDQKHKKLRTALLLFVLMAVIYFVTVMIKL